VAVALPLQHPSPELVEIYEMSGIVAVRDASYFFAGVVGIMLVPRVVVWLAQEFCTINVVDLDDLSSSHNNNHLNGDYYMEHV
jgi:hypothetical protein